MKWILLGMNVGCAVGNILLKHYELLPLNMMGLGFVVWIFMLEIKK